MKFRKQKLMSFISLSILCTASVASAGIRTIGNGPSEIPDCPVGMNIIMSEAMNSDSLNSYTCAPIVLEDGSQCMPLFGGENRSFSCREIEQTPFGNGSNP